MTATPSAERPPPEHQGLSLGARYRSLFVLGRGGMGSVEAAVETTSARGEPSARIVALKRLLPDVVRDKRRVEMFLREARLAAMLDHPNVVHAYDYGEIEGELFLSMEYVEGQPLSRVLHALAGAKEQMSSGAVTFLLAQVCRGLHAAHELTDPETGRPLGLVHRDVSPHNVMIAYDGRVRLLDFGIAKIEAENLTRTGEVKGKTAYMSPEQAMGDTLDRRSDLFGVGAILFECLALRRMWGDGTDIDVIRKLALEKPPALEGCGRPLPPGLSEVFARLVAQTPAGRPATALDVAMSLEALTPDRTKADTELRGIVDRFFASEANERRARLVASLQEVVPESAETLRASMTPSLHPPPASRRAASIAAPSTERARRPRTLLLLSAGVLAAIFVGWSIRDRAPEPRREGSPEVVPTTSVQTAASTASVTEPMHAIAPTTPSAVPTDASAPSQSANVASTPRPRPSATITAPPTRTPPSPSVKPPEVDEKPF